jgi:nitrogenase iron protein NifH
MGANKKIAFYGKGGIGKSTTAANVSAALSLMGQKVCQIGCDPKNDSTRLLLGGICKQTVLDYVRERGEENLDADKIIHTGFNGVKCVEAGGPEPGIGCAGRGIIVALEKLKELAAIDESYTVLYDVLGDVVCGGFAVPIREGYAADIYIVSSGELMSLYAGNNIAKCVKRFAERGNARLGGIIGNSRNMEKERELLEEFAHRLNTRLVSFIPRDIIVNKAEVNKKTVVEWQPDSPQAEVYKKLARSISANTELSVPNTLEFNELEELTAKYGGQ